MFRIISVIVVLVLAVAGPVAALELYNTSTIIGGVVFKTSKNVRLTARSNQFRYSAISEHNQGDREFGTQHHESKLYYRSKVQGAASTCDDPAYDFSTWNAQ